MTTEADPVDPVLTEDDLVTVSDKPREPTEYERRLRRESAKHRTDAKMARDEVERIKAAQENEKEAIRAQAKADADLRVIRAELKAAAIAAGMVDLDGLKLLDLSGVKLSESGDIEGADALFAAAKTAKPYLFGDKSSTTSPVSPPPIKAPEAKNARDMSPEEYAIARKQVTAIRR